MTVPEYDFGLTLEPGRWALWIPSARAWDLYRPVLRKQFGREAFQVRTVQGGSGEVGGKGTRGVFVVLDVFKPIDVENEFIVRRSVPYQEGMTPQSLGWTVPGAPDFIFGANEVIDEVKEFARAGKRATKAAADLATLFLNQGKGLVLAATGLVVAWTIYKVVT